MNYTIVGCITKYGIEDIKPFVESIEQSGYTGEKLMLVYEISNDTILIAIFTNRCYYMV